jgi:TolA-binding protein
MSVVDLHPEELLDKDERGELTADERVRLDAHLDRCSACRAEVVLRADFASELHGLDDEDRPSALLDLVQGALAAPRVATVPPAASPSPAPSPTPSRVDESRVDESLPEAIPGLRRRPRRTAIVLLVAAAVMAASAAGATGLTGRIWLGLRANGQEVTHPNGEAMAKAAPATTNGRAAAARLGSVAATATEATATATEVEAPSEPVLEPQPQPVTLPAPAGLPITHVAFPPARAPNPAVAVAPAPAPAPTTPAPTTASGLFDSANAARRDGDTTTALARYDALGVQYPQSPEARVAKATTGKLLLDRGDAAGALSRFDAYLASGASELREEAMAGRATALERLGRGDDEVRAWAALLAAYPGTPYAVHAKTRVGRSLGR